MANNDKVKKMSNLDKIRHSTAHLLAHAVSELYPGTLLTIGPVTKDGFFYDFLPKKNFKEEDLNLIDTRMRILAEKDIPIEQKEISKEKAKELFKDNPFKLELIEEIPGDTVGLSVQGDFYDLCHGGHASSTGKLKNFKLTAIAGSYWRGDREKAALQRISGTAFETTKDLEKYEKHLEEIAKYDHRVLGKQMELFNFMDVAPGAAFFLPKGQVIINQLKKYIRSLMEENNYKEVNTPTLLKAEIWKKSGHWNYYKDHMYLCKTDKDVFGLKPMNCPGAMLIYKNKPRSYRDLPLRLSEFGYVHRYELSGTLHSLMRVRAFTQDDAHIFCQRDQIEDEVGMILQNLINKILKKFNLSNARFAVSTKPNKALGSDEMWEIATKALTNSLEKNNLEYEILPKKGAFYGPKIEVVVTDAFGREWTCGTIQADFMGPQNFNLEYTTSKGTKEKPAMIHHAIYGSLERFFGIILEHYKGNLPIWIAPVQAKILPISKDQLKYAKKIFAKLKEKNIRVELDESGDPISALIKKAQLERVATMIIIGAKEQENKNITVRYLDGQQEKTTLKNFLEKTNFN